MPGTEIPDSAINAIARHINERSNKEFHIPVIGNENNLETPQVFEIIPFDQIDNSKKRFYAIDGSYNSEQFYNGLSVGIYAGGYICFQEGKPIRMNSIDDPVILGKAYYPQNILVTHPEHLIAIYDELLTLQPVKNLLDFFNDSPSRIFPYKKEQICANLSTLLGFCQEILEIALILEIINLPETKAGDFILRDGTLRPLQIKQNYLVELGKYAHQKGVKVVAVTKQSAIKMELAYTFKKIDSYLQDELKDKYPFVETNPTAISDEIRTQAENFFAFHMGNSDDIKALVKSNINYDGVIAKFIQRETIPGNLYMVSSDQAFALPVRVTEFEKLVINKVYKDSKFNS